MGAREEKCRMIHHLTLKKEMPGNSSLNVKKKSTILVFATFTVKFNLLQ